MTPIFLPLHSQVPEAYQNISFKNPEKSIKPYYNRITQNISKVSTTKSNQYFHSTEQQEAVTFLPHSFPPEVQMPSRRKLSLLSSSKYYLTISVYMAFLIFKNTLSWVAQASPVWSEFPKLGRASPGQYLAMKEVEGCYAEEGIGRDQIVHGSIPGLLCRGK